MKSTEFTSTSIEIHRERILTELSRVRSPDNETPSPLDLEALFNRAAFVSNKANVLARAIEEEAIKFFIPVHPGATETVAAVRRKSNDGDGTRISFDLYKNAIEAMQRTNKEVSDTIILSKEIEPGQVLNKRIRKTRARISLSQQTGSEPDDDLLEILLSQFLLLWLAHTLMKPFEGIEEHIPLSQAWVDKGGVSGTTIAVAQVLIGLAAQYIIMDLNDDIMETYLDQATGGVYPQGFNAQSIIAEARKLELTPELELAKLQIGLNDYETILDYSFEYLGKTVEPGYEMWIAYADVVVMRNNAQNLWVQAPHYSVPHALYQQDFDAKGKRARQAQRRRARQLDEEDDAYDDRRDLELQQAVIAGLIPMAQQSYVTRLDTLDQMSDTLDLIGQVLASDFAITAACCVGQYLEKMDTNVLKTIRGFLEGLLRAYAFDSGNALRALYSHLVSPNFEEIYALEAMHEIDKIFERLIENVLDMFDESINELLQCDLIGRLIEGVLDAINRLEAELYGAIEIFAGRLVQSIGIGTLGIKDRYNRTYDARIIRKMIMIVDAILAAAESMDACTENKDLFAPLPDAARLNIRLPSVTIDADESTNYFSTAVDRVTSSGKLLPALGEEIVTTTPEKLSEEFTRIVGN